MKLQVFKTTLAALFLSFASIAMAQSFKFIALGDMPYNIPEDYVRYERLIQRINSKSPAFSIFVGDTKSGSTPCSDEYNLIVEGYFKKFISPLLYSPGDNEWTDCHRPLAGSYDPIERLQTLRQKFFQSKFSLGKQKISLTRQADLDPHFSKFVENSLWVKNHFLFVNVHITGSNNNFERDDRSKAEYYERNQANLSWIKYAFQQALKMNYQGIIFSYQADMFFSPKQAIESESGYRETLQLLSTSAEAFKKPILLIHGDSHRLVIDQPLKTVDQKHVLENVIRLEVMGANEVQAVEIQVNPGQEQPFSFTPLLLRDNMVMPSPK
jgi:hypothetical protein